MKLHFSLAVFFLFFLTTFLAAQDCSSFYRFVENATYEYGLFDQKDKPEGRMLYRVSNVAETADGFSADIHSKIIPEKKNQETMETDSKITCTDGTLQMDLSMNFSQMMSQFSSMEVTMEGEPLLLPAKLEAGQTLPDATSKIKTAMNGMNLMSVNISVTDRKVEGKESITTPAGTFECYKISQTTHVKTIMGKTYQSVEYYAEGVGLVQSETYGKNGKLEGKQVLLSLEE